MIQLDPGTILEKEYKGKKVVVKVLKDGEFKYDGKIYPSRQTLMKGITKGKAAQFTTFFKLNHTNKSEKKVVAEMRGITQKDIVAYTPPPASLENVISIDTAIREIIRDEIRNFFRG